MQSRRDLDENLLCYLLDGLDDTEKSQVEGRLRDDEATRSRLEQLRVALEPLAADKEDAAPPPGLVSGVIGLVAEHCCRELPRAPAPVAAAVGRNWWRRADLMVAASLLVVAAGLGLPALLNLRSGGSPAAVAECSNNLRTYYTGLQAYRDTHGHFPNVANVATDKSRNVAGMVVPVLHQAGVLPASASLRCPGNGKPVAPTLTFDQAQSMPLDEFLRKVGSCYAYSLGWKDQAGNYHGPAVVGDELPENFLALMSDCPPTDVLNNSLNHAGRGQNVLFGDGNVKFLKVRNAGFAGDDIFRNREGKVAAGTDCQDTVLGFGAARP